MKNRIEELVNKIYSADCRIDIAMVEGLDVQIPEAEKKSAMDELRTLDESLFAELVCELGYKL